MGARRFAILVLLVFAPVWFPLSADAVQSPFVGAPSPSGAYATHGYAWENNTIGISDVVPAPWTALAYAGNRISCWGREFDLGAGGMPAQITSQGRPLFARAPSLELAVDGAPVLGAGAATPSVTTRGRSRAEYTFTRHDASLDVELRGVLEYDGFLKITLTLTPRGAVTIDKLLVTLPFTRDVGLFSSRYIQYDFDQQVLDRADFSGSIALLDKPVDMRFNPAVWVGNHDVGVEWSCETNAYWAPEDPARVIRIAPEAGGVTMRIGIVGRPLRIDAPVSYAFALYPTPVKPLPADWRGIAVGNAGARPPGVDSRTHRMYGLGMLGRFPVRYPGLPGQVAAAQAPLQDRGPRAGESVEEGRRKLRDWGVRYVPYGALYGMPAVLPESEWKDYGAEWRIMNPRGEVRNRLWARLEGLGERDPSLIYICPWSRSFQDFLVWQYARAMERDGIGGMYLDLSSPNFLCQNPNHPHGRFVAGGGEYYPFFAQRELMKRFYTAFKGKDPDFLIMQHHAKVPVVCSGFSDVVVSGEALNLFFGFAGGRGRNAPENYDPDYSRLPDLFFEVQYAQTRGFVNMLLPQIVKGNENAVERDPGRTKRLTQGLLARCAVYDIPVCAMRLDRETYEAYLRAQERFGWLSGAEYIGPRESSKFLTKTGDAIRCALYMKKDGAFLVVSNLGPGDARGSLSLNTRALAGRGLTLSAGAKVLDAGSGAVLGGAGGTIDVQVPANDMRLLMVR